jgi:hypothetical protein
VLALVTRQKAPAFRPGSKFAYDNTAYFLLGRAVERISGQSLARFADKHVFRPLGMTSTYLDDNPARVVRNRAVGYDLNPDGTLRRWTTNSSAVGARGLKTTVEDLFRWDQNFYANRLPDGPRLREFLKSGTLLGNRKVLDVDPAESYRGLKRMGFTGGLPGFVAGFVPFPEEKFSVICLSNDGTRPRPWALALRIADIYLADQMKGRKKPEAAAPKYAFVDLAESDLTDKVGAYRVTRTRMVWTVSVVKGELVLTDRVGETDRWRALSSTRFRSVEEQVADEQPGAVAAVAGVPVVAAAGGGVDAGQPRDRARGGGGRGQRHGGRSRAMYSGVLLRAGVIGSTAGRRSDHGALRWRSADYQAEALRASRPPEVFSARFDFLPGGFASGSA